jgi:hypothetical protein
VFHKQERQISTVTANLASHQVRTSKLRITPHGNSRYILSGVGGIPHADFDGGYVSLGLMIENTGSKNSTVDRFQIEIPTLNATFANLQTVDGKNGVQGRHCQYNFDPRRFLSKTGLVRIAAESATDRGELLFFLSGLTLDQFIAAGLTMSGAERKFGTLHCRLTLTDTTGSSASAEFDLQEA